MFLELGVILETRADSQPYGRKVRAVRLMRSLYVSFSKVLADEALVMLGPHVGKQLIRAKEGFVAELRHQLPSMLPHTCQAAHLAHGMRGVPSPRQLDVLASRFRRPLSLVQSSRVVKGQQVGWVQDLFMREAE